MSIEVKIPSVGESITEVQIGNWLKSEGDTIARDEPIVELESDKATVELPAPAAGRLEKVLRKTGDKAVIGEIIAYIETDGAAVPDAKKTKRSAPKAAAQTRTETPPPAPVEERPHETGSRLSSPSRPYSPSDRPRGTGLQPVSSTPPASEQGRTGAVPRVMPAARRVLAQEGVSADDIEPTGPGGRLLKEDVLRHIEARREESATKEGALAPAELPVSDREEEIVPMSPIRRRIAQRLLEAQQTAALLTTFNEIDMSAIMALRQQHQPAFQERYGVKLGIMSFFVKASIDALQEVPQVNAEIRGDVIAYRNYYDIGIAVGGGKGLVVPVLRNAERLSFAEIELAIADFAARAKDNKLKLEELEGGTFTISNGGIYGSMLSTPIVNPPQSGILGLHAIQDRPVARAGQVVIRPMMYVALTYDHRLVDGREAVTFLRRIKEVIEEPARLLLEI